MMRLMYRTRDRDRRKKTCHEMHTILMTHLSLRCVHIIMTQDECDVLKLY